MTNSSLYDALEICLQMLERGADIESCVKRFPEYSDELRPILAAAVRARSATANTVPVDVMRRGRAKVMQAAAEMREQKAVVAVVPFWRKTGLFGNRFIRTAITTSLMIAFLLTGGTGLVNASSVALPGDQLYPVKRSWEGVRLIFVFDEHSKESLENEFDHERVQEIEELYSEKRIAEVNFQGVVQEQNDKTWVIGGLNIRIGDETMFSGNILPGSVVQVMGETDDGHIKAQQIILLATPGVTPSAIPSATIIYTDTPQPGVSPESRVINTLVPSTKSSDDSLKDSESPTTKPKDDKDDEDSHHDNATPTPTSEHSDDEDDHEHKTPRPTGEH